MTVLHDALIGAFADLRPDERRAVALNMQDLRDRYAKDALTADARWNRAWAHLFAVVSAAAHEADRIESSTVKAMEADLRGSRWLADDGEPEPFDPSDPVAVARQRRDQKKLDDMLRAGVFDD